MARTRFSDIARTFKPNLASLGYALFLAINAAGVWGGVFPFLPMSFQTPEITFWFFLAQSLVFSLCYFTSAVGVYYFPGPTRKFIVMLASAPYLLGWCCLIGAIYVHDAALPLVVAGGALLGLGSAGFYMLWQRLFASLDTDRGNHDLILGTAYGALLYFALYAIPQAVTAFLIPLVFMPLFALAITLKSREIDLRQPMFDDIPRDHPQVYRRVLRDYWRPALRIGAMAFCAGVMRALAIGEPQVGSLVNMMSMLGCLVAGAGVLVLWQFKNVRMNVSSAYRVAFPIIITSFLLLPFLTIGYARWQAAILYAVYSVGIVLMMIQCAQVSRDRGINPVFIYGFVAGVVYALHDVGFLAGTFAEQIRVIGMEPTAIVALVAVYLLGLMFFIGQGGFKRALAGADAEDIELMAGAAAGALSAADVEERLTDLDEGEAAPGGETARATVMLDSCAAACPYAGQGSGSSVKPIIIPLAVKGMRGPAAGAVQQVPKPATKAMRAKPSVSNPQAAAAAPPSKALQPPTITPRPRSPHPPGAPTAPRTRTAFRSRQRLCASITACRRAKPRSWSSSRAATPSRASPNSWWCPRTPSARTASASTPNSTSTKSKSCSTLWKRSTRKTSRNSASVMARIGAFCS